MIPQPSWRVFDRVFRAGFVGFLIVGISARTFAADRKRPLEFDDLVGARRLSDPQVSPDGSWVAYVVTKADKAENRTDSDIWLAALSGGPPRQLTASPKHDRHPRWSPDGKWIAFESNRGGAFQLYLIPADGGEARQLTTLSTEATQPIWSPDG